MIISAFDFSLPYASLNLSLLTILNNLRSLTQYSCKIKATEMQKKEKCYFLSCLATPFLVLSLRSIFDIEGVSELVEDIFSKKKNALQPGYVFNLWRCQYPGNTGTYKEPLGDLAKTNGKIDIFTVKMYFESNSLCIAYLFLVFTGGSNIPNSLMETLMGRSESKSWDTLGTSVGYQRNKF